MTTLHDIEFDHPVEDDYGTEILPDDDFLIDDQGRVVLECNLKRYVVDQNGAVFFKAK